MARSWFAGAVSLAAVAILIFSSTTVIAQTAGGGYIPYSSYTSNKYDIINNTNLNLMLSVPVRSKAGLIPFNFSLQMNNQVTAGSVATVGTSLQHSIVGLGRESHVTEGGVCPNPPTNTPTTIYRGFTFYDPTGAIRSFPNIQWDTEGCLGDRLSELTNDTVTDGTGLYGSVFLNSDGSPKALQITDLAGNLWNYNASVPDAFFTDKNGNTLQLNSNGQFTDTTNAVVLTESLGYGYNGNDKYTYNDSSGNPQMIKVEYTNETQETNWGCGIDISPHSVQMPTTVSFPDGTSLGISYETTPGDTHNPNYVTGRIASLTLPTSGVVTFTYTGGVNGMSCTTGTAPVFSRIENGLTTSFTRTIINSNTQTQTVVTLPFGGTETIVANIVGNQVVSDVLTDSGGNTIKTTSIVYDGGGAFGPVRNLSTYTYLGSTSVLAGSKKVYTNLDTTYYALPVESTVYLPANSTTAYTDTVTTYSTLGFPHSVIATANGSTIATTNYTYDGHNNELSVSTLVGGAQYLSSSKTYNSNGSVKTSTDTFGATTTNDVTSCNDTMPATSVFNSITTTLSWDCDGGVLDSSADTNGTAQMQYIDPLYRPSQNTDKSSFSTNISYGTTYVQTQTLVGSATVTKDTSVDGFGNPSSTQTLNGSSYDTVSSTYTGHFLASTSLPCSTSTLGGTCPTTKFTYAYDSVGRLSTKTDATTGATKSYLYNANDTLITTSGGTSPTVATQTEVDGLGRLVSVCEINSLTGNGPCGQSHTATGFETTYTYNALGQLITVTQYANSTSPQLRQFTYDLIGRKLTESTPEGGTVQFWYDSAASSTPGATCSGTYKGKLVKRYDARTNTTCYTYDSVGRMSSVVYSGPGSNGINKYFVYDSAVVNSQTMLNTTNRLAEAYTAASSAGTKVTDMGYSYSARGDKTDVYESTPNSGGYYHTISSYYSNGALNTLSGISGEPSWTFGLDSLGRPNSIAETANCGASCRTVLSSVNYNLGRVTGINYGSGDFDTFDYSATTGQETDFNLYVGTLNTHPRLTANLSWFPTGQLQQQQFVDTINLSDSQTCAYGYDSLNRLSSDSCGTAWAQTFAYDQFGNMVKSGSLSFAATYNSKNQIATLGSTVPTYDASGNLLTINTGTQHVYTWDAENRIASIDGKTLVYDAFDRVVEEGSSLQILYGPTGKLGTMNGQTAQRVYISLPKGAQLVYDASQSANPIAFHPDLMGNSVVGSDFNRHEVFSRFFAPFGEVYENSGSTVANFTGNTQDLDANLYDFTYREQSPVQGRWLNPDPSGMAAVSYDDPQTLNRYAYVRGSAMGMIDANGLGSAWGWALRSFLNAAFGNVTPPPGWVSASNWMAGNLYATFPPYSGPSAVETSYTVTLPGQGDEIQPTIAPGAMFAWRVSISILMGQNSCANFFNLAASSYTSGDDDAADILAHTSIELSTTRLPITTAATTVGGSGGSTPITINPEGAFFPQMPGARPLEPPFPPGTLQEQVLTIFHEFAHDINAIPDDGRALLGGPGPNTGQSFANTNIILINCYTQIKSGGP